MLRATVILVVGLGATLSSAVHAGPTLGKISFVNSGAPDAQQAFLDGILWLHSFEYTDAREAFQRAKEIDPEFVMAYWGEAMTHNHPIWLRQDRDKGLAALLELGKTADERAAKAPTQRERDYLAALGQLYGEGDKLSRDLAYANAMRRIHERYPDDLEAGAFYALSLLGTCHDGRDFPTYMKAAAIVEEVFAKNPQHPGAAHYLIHSYDDAVHAPLGLRAARVYAQLATAAPHAQHMPSHIFLALGMWDETVSSNVASWESAEVQFKVRGNDKNFRGYHALAWLAYAYLQQGRVEDAQRLLAVMRDDAVGEEMRRVRSYLAAMRANHVVETRHWDTSELEIETADIGAQATVADLFARGYSALELGKPELAAKLFEELKRHRLARVAEAESGCHASNDDSVDNLPALQAAEVMEIQLRALMRLHRGEAVEAIALLRDAVALESSIALEFGPPGIVKPSHELLGEVLLDQGSAAEALEQFALALRQAPGRSLSLLGKLRAASATDQVEIAGEAYAQLRRNWSAADRDTPALELLVVAR